VKLKWLKINPLIGFNDIPFIVLGTPVVGAFVTMVFFGVSVQNAFQCMWVNFWPANISTLIFWLGDRYITIRFRKKYPDFSNIRKRLVYQSIVILAYTAAMSIPLKMSEGVYDNQFTNNIGHPGFFKSFIACLFATIPISAIYEATYFLHQWKQSIAEAERLKRQHTQSQLEALRNQINPHFLFNSLNTLSSLIPEDPKTSVDFVQKLSSVYRTILDLREKPVVTLREELEFLDDYIYLIKTRFGESIHFNRHIEQACYTCYLAPLSIQMLVENAIKHNITSSKKPLQITITANEGQIVISNNLQPKAQPTAGTGTGLDNIRNRYRLIFHQEIEVEKEETSFKVTLPLVKIEAYERNHY
jgi:two-component system, LytTR family, sensor kinase